MHIENWMLYIATPFSLQCRELQSIITVSVAGLLSLVVRVVEKTSSEQLQQCSCDSHLQALVAGQRMMKVLLKLKLNFFDQTLFLFSAALCPYCLRW